MAGRILYLVGGAPRVGKSALAQLLLRTDGIPWLPTDVIRTVLRRVLPNLDAVDTDPVDAVRLAELMYPHIEQAAEVCAEEAERFLIEGFELAPSYPQRLRAALRGTATVRACFLGHGNSPQTIWPPTAARNRSTRRRPHRPNSLMPPPGFVNVAISSATNAVSEGFPTSMWVHWAIRSQCATRVSISSGPEIITAGYVSPRGTGDGTRPVGGSCVRPEY